MNWNVPNYLTIGRVAAAPMLALCFVVLPRPLADWTAFVIFTLAGATDFLDGWLARRWGQESEFGKMLDPIADKAMVAIAMVVLVGVTAGAWTILIPATLILFREVLVAGLREYLAGRLTIHVTTMAKYKTTAQMLAVGGLLLWETGAFGAWMWTAAHATLWLAVFLTLATGWDYFQKAMTYIMAEEER
jgi:CDP-diacylglycerol--glycerol-3-phosphate 3-phosphatidyltransferase